MIVGCYTLHLYCDHEECRHDMAVGKKTGPREITGETYQECAKLARRWGWHLSYDQQRCLCPKHSGKKPRRAG